MSVSNPGVAPLSLAAVALRARQIRNRAFDRELFADPAWDILLSLWVRGPQTPREMAAQLSLSPELTLRWVDILLGRSLLEKGHGETFTLTAPAQFRLNMIFDNAISIAESD